MSDSQTRSLFEFSDAEPLVDLGILASVTPGVHHYHLIPVGVMFTNMFLIVTESHKRRQSAFPEHSGHTGVQPDHPVAIGITFRRSDAGHGELSGFADEVGLRISKLHRRARSLLKKKETVPVHSVPGKEQVAFIARPAVWDECTLSHKVVVPVCDIEELDGLYLPVQTSRVKQFKMTGLAFLLPLYVIGGLYVLVVSGIGKSFILHRSQTSCIIVTGDGRAVLIHPEHPAHTYAVHRERHLGFQMLRMDAVRLHLSYFQTAIQSLSERLPDSKSRLRRVVHEHPASAFVLHKSVYDVSSVPEERTFNQRITYIQSVRREMRVALA